MDISSSMLFPFTNKKIFNKLAFSVYCAAALIHLLRKQRDAVGLSLFSDELELQTPARLSSVHSQLLFSELSRLLTMGKDNLKKTTSATKNLHLIAENVHKRSLIIIFSDMLDSEPPAELFSALQHLRYNKHEVILFHVTDKKHEEDFEYKNRPYKFIDMESGEEMKINPNEIRGEYKKRISNYFEELKLKCAQYKIDVIEADINKDFRQVLMPYLLKRNKLY